MNYIVLDLEWNQSSGKNDYELPFEIVEIGAVKLNRKFEIVDRFEELIKPQIYRSMHFMTSKIIHLEKEELESGKPFPEVMQQFLKWCGRNYVFCIWGTLDLTELQKNMCYYGMDELSAGPLKYYDIQKFFSLTYEDGKMRRALEYAVDYLHIQKDIPFHRAYSDAYYTAKVFIEINRKDPAVEKYVSYDVFMVPQSKKEEIRVNFKTYAKYISREFPDKTVALEDKVVASTKCYVCGRASKKRIKWFSANGKHYYSLSYCKKHGYLKGKIRMKKTEDGNVYVVKTLKLISPEEAVEIWEKQNKIRKMRAEKRKIHKESKKSK
ncbi:MAG: exonuclease domain-containing protein [Lachnospiraceae bacterium]|nr:exonuclease domain-containing protein [Lachnospiraceae bacterium]